MHIENNMTHILIGVITRVESSVKIVNISFPVRTEFSELYAKRLQEV